MSHSKPIQATALFTVLTFVLTNNWMIPTAHAEVLRTEFAQIRPFQVEGLKLPAKFGEVVEYFDGDKSNITGKGKSDQAVIIIQDAHAIPDAQKNIANVIKYMQQEYGVGTVALEGASGDLDPQIFKSLQLL